MPVLTGTTMEKSKISSYGIDMNGTDLKKFPANSQLNSNSNKSPRFLPMVYRLHE